MIENEHQYKISKTWLIRFQEALAETEERAREDSLLMKAQLRALESQIENLQAEIAEYEARNPPSR